ncbi:MAG: transglycosylase domain-containing protein [Parvularculaceae bacterium]
MAFLFTGLPSTDEIWRVDRAPQAILVARDGSPLPTRGRSQGAPVRLAELPAHAPAAVLAIEDRNFHRHIGVNPVSMARALLVNLRHGEVRQGGSTITQQLAKNLFLSSDRSYARKIRELLLAFWLEAKFTKDEILTLYLNRVYFGAGAYGLSAASWRYFDKPATDLTLGEAAILAGLLKAPTRLAPTRDPESAGARGAQVIDAMEAAGFIDAAGAAAARAEGVRLRAAPANLAPHFVDAALVEARRRAPFIGRVRIETTLDPALQAALVDGARAGLAIAARGPGFDPQAEVALVLIDGSGAVRGLVGGRDYARSQFNRATDARRQPGAAFKPFVYLAAIEAGMKPRSRVDDAPIAVGAWRPSNYGGRYLGETRLEDALAQSLNAATVRLQERVGRAAVRRAARRMGLESPLSPGAALALGVDVVTPLELAAAYAPLVNGGYRVRLRLVSRVIVDDVEAFAAPTSVEGLAAKPRDLARLDAMLARVVTDGTGRRADVPGARVAGKTGTTQDSRDAWFVGYAGGHALAVWIGRDDDAPMRDPVNGRAVVGGGAPAIVWREAMARVLNVADPLRSVAVAAPAD